MRSTLIILAALIAMLYSAGPWANDTTARVGAGGITFLKNEDIRMLQEKLTVSTSSIRVQYRFLNEAARDVRATVAFPMPPYGWNPGESASDANEKPMDSFSIVVNGLTVKPSRSRRAIVRDRDITSELKALRLSDAQIFESFGDTTLEGHGLKSDQAKRLAALGGLKDSYPTWKVAETAHWEQLFPARREVAVEHTYKPFVGMVYSGPFQNGQYVAGSGVPTASWDKDPNEACLDQGTRKSIEQRIKSLVENGAATVWVTLNDVEYVLGTGRNWKGPIGDFTLTIEKDSPDQLVSLCFPGKPGRIDARTLQFNHSNFEPQDRLIVYFYTLKAEYK